VLGLSRQGMWLLVGDKEFYLPFDLFPWFADARVRDVYKVELLHEDHLYWPELDVDLELASLLHPEGYPLIYH